MISKIIVSVSADRIEYMHRVMNRFNHRCVSLIEGAETRHRSIFNAVKAIPSGIQLTIVIEIIPYIIYISMYSIYINIYIYIYTY